MSVQIELNDWKDFEASDRGKIGSNGVSVDERRVGVGSGPSWDCVVPCVENVTNPERVCSPAPHSARQFHVNSPSKLAKKKNSEGRFKAGRTFWL